MSRSPSCDCRCDEGPCSVPLSCAVTRCLGRVGGIGRTYKSAFLVPPQASDITPTSGTGTCSGITAIDHTDPDVLVACNRAGDLYRTTDRGDDWTCITNSGVAWNDIHSSGNQVIVVGRLAPMFGVAGITLRSSDAGVTWSFTVSASASPLNAIWMLSAAKAFACGDGGVILRTLDGGATWTPMTSGTSANLYDIHFANSRYGFAVGAAGTVLRTADGGATWEAIPGISDDVDCVWLFDTDDGVIFSRLGSATTLWTWDGTTLTSGAAGPTVATGRLNITGITCTDENPVSETGTKYVTRADGCVVAPSFYVRFTGSNTVSDGVPAMEHHNSAGDVSYYTTSTKVWGGTAINSYALTHDADYGHDHPSMKLSVNWTQAATLPFRFPQPEALPGTGYEDLFGAWVVMELTGGPHVTLAAGERFSGPTLDINTRQFSLTGPVGVFLRFAFSGSVPASGGTFTITVDGEVTSALAYSASIATVQAALNALTTVNGHAVVSGWPLDTAFGSNRFAIVWDDNVERTVTADGMSLTPVGTVSVTAPTGSIDVVPVAIQGGTVYGPFVARLVQQTAGGGAYPCWSYRTVGPNCSLAYTPGDTGYQTYSLHSRYREFLENPAAIPNGIGTIACQAYCQDEDAFGDWATATIERYDPRFFEAQPSNYDTWVPNTPEFSEGSYTMGFAVGVSGGLPGTYNIVAHLDNVCLDWSVTPALENCGTLIIDEPMSASVPTWTISAVLQRDPPSMICPSQSLFGASWRIEDGWMIADAVYDGLGGVIPMDTFVGVAPYFWRELIYGGGSLFKILDPFTFNSSNFCLIVECELERIHERDAEYYAADQPDDPSHGTSLDLNLVRPEEDFGIFIGGLCRFGVHRNAFQAGDNQSHTCDRSYYYLQIDGRVDTNGQLETLCAPAHHGEYECDDLDEMGTHWVSQGAMHFHTQPNLAPPSVEAVPLKTDKLRLKVDWAGLAETVNDCRAQFRVRVSAWLNDRELWMHSDSFGTANVSLSPEATGSPSRKVAWLIEDKTVGVYAIRGGKFRNFKAWLQT